MKKKLNKIIAMLLIGCLTFSGMSINSFAAVGTNGRKAANRSTGQTSFYQDGALSAAYSENEAAEKYSAPAAGTYEGDLYQALKNFESEINVSKYKVPVEEALEAYRCLINANPDLFFVSNALSYYREIYCENCGGYVAEAENGGWILLDDTFLKGTLCDHQASHNWNMYLTHWEPRYITENKSQLATMTAEFNKAVEKALAGIDNSMSDLEKALYCHDYIVKSNAYDYDSFTQDKVPAVSHSAYGALVLNTSVCDGYSLAFSYLMKQCGINARLVTSDSMKHAWNAVEIDGSWYFVDLTNDDPVCGFYKIENGEYVLSRVGDDYSLVCHNAFLASEELWKNTEYSDGCYNGWAQTDIKCDNTKYDNAIWKTAENEYGYCDGYWYYLAQERSEGSPTVDDAAIMRTTDPAEAGEIFLSLSEYKNTWGFSANSYWPGIFSKVSVYAPDKKLLFNTGDKIYMIDLTDSTKTPHVYIDLADTEFAGVALVFGMIVVGDYLYFGIQNDPNLDHLKFRQYLGGYVTGDVNGDSAIDSKDALEILKYDVGMGSSDFISAAAFVNEDDVIDSKDALEILKYDVGLIDTFPSAS